MKKTNIDSKSPSCLKNMIDSNGMSFPEALEHVIEGECITKLEWDNEVLYGFLNDKILSLHKSDGKNYQWIITDGDLLGKDWVVVGERKI